MAQDMSYMYDSALRQKAVSIMQEQGVPLTGDNLQRAMALIANTSVPEEHNVDVREAAADPKLTGDILSRFMDATDRKPATGEQRGVSPGTPRPAQATSDATTPGTASDSGSSPPPLPTKADAQPVAVKRGQAAASAGGTESGRSLDTTLKQLGADFATKAGNALDQTLTMDNIGLALLGLTAPAGAISRAGSAVMNAVRREPSFTRGAADGGQKLLEGPGQQKLLPPPAKQITASPEAKRTSAVQMLQERIGTELSRLYQQAMQRARPGSTYSVQLH